MVVWGDDLKAGRLPSVSPISGEATGIQRNLCSPNLVTSRIIVDIRRVHPPANAVKQMYRTPGPVPR